MVTSTFDERRGGSFLKMVRWNKAVQAGLLAGATLFLLSRGIPWVGSGAINPAVMGREISPGNDPGGSLLFGVFLLHMLLSVAYSLIIAAIVHGFRPLIAGAVGAVVGLVLYFLSYAIWGILTEVPGSQREWPALVLHIVFGLFAAEAYKGMAKRRPAPVL